MCPFRSYLESYVCLEIFRIWSRPLSLKGIFLDVNVTSPDVEPVDAGMSKHGMSCGRMTHQASKLNMVKLAVCKGVILILLPYVRRFGEERGDMEWLTLWSGFVLPRTATTSLLI